MKKLPKAADIDAAIEHLCWCAENQSAGYFPVRVFRHTDDGRLIVLVTRWFDNRHSRLAGRLKAFLMKYRRDRVTVLYSPNSFSKKQAKAEFALPGKIAYVDADKGRVEKFSPDPTRIIKSSEDGEHWFWLLSHPLPPEDLQAVNKALSREVGGDKGGHSPAKLFRLPGFENLKRKPSFRVALHGDTGEIHDPAALLARADDVKQRRASSDDVGNALAASTRLNSNRIAKKYWRKLSSGTRARLRQRRVLGAFSLRIRGFEPARYAGDDRSEIIWGIALDFRQAGATPAETLAVITSTIFWKARERDGKAEDPERLLERVFETELDVDEQKAVPESLGGLKSALEAVDPADWAGLPKPERKWIIENWIPLLKVTLLYGDGGTGKTLLALMLTVAVALGLRFLGLPVRQGRVYALLGENDETDTHISLVDVCRHYGVGLSDLKGRVRVASRSGFENMLMSFNKGTGVHTKLFDELLEELKEFDADLVILETAVDLYGGNENARGEVRQFVANCVEVIAKEVNAAVVLCAHPSVAGLRTGDGTAGSTAWSNSARSRLYLRREIDEDGNEADQDHRVLSRMKANFAARQDSIDLYWRDGAFVVDDAVVGRSTISETDRKVITEVERAFEAETPWSAHHQAGVRFIGMWICPNLKQSRKGAKATIARLLAENRIVTVEIDSHTRKTGLCTPEQAENLMRNKKAK